MELTGLVLLMLVLVVVGSAVARAVPAVPVPFVQLALGAAAGFLGGFELRLDPEVFLMLFVPPLLFLDGWRIPNDELVAERGAVLRLALGLVLLTVGGVGLLVAWMIPAVPLAVAFALAAVVAPTDPIAVSAIAGRTPVPRRMMRVLEGESLLNDASGLACLRVAVTAVVTARFSVGDALLTFTWMGLGGLSIGAAVAFGILRMRNAVGRHVGHEAGAYILCTLLVPFAAYLAADQAGCSGVLAAVAAGFTVSALNTTAASGPATRVQSRAVWDMVQFTLNGLTFVLLGAQLPTVLSHAGIAAQQAGHASAAQLLGYVAAITAALFALRLAWVTVSVRVALRHHTDGDVRSAASWRAVGATTCAGAKGAITLAGVLTLPFTVAGGAAFPARELAVLLATGVILASLLVAAVGLPLLLRGLEMPPDAEDQAQEAAARLAAMEAAVGALEAVDDAHRAAADRVARRYRRHIAAREGGDSADRVFDTVRAEEAMARVAIKAEHEAVLSLLHRGKIGTRVAEKVIGQLDLVETRLGG